MKAFLIEAADDVAFYEGLATFGGCETWDEVWKLLPDGIELEYLHEYPCWVGTHNHVVYYVTEWETSDPVLTRDELASLECEIADYIVSHEGIYPPHGIYLARGILNIILGKRLNGRATRN